MPNKNTAQRCERVYNFSRDNVGLVIVKQRADIRGCNLVYLGLLNRVPSKFARNFWPFSFKYSNNHHSYTLNESHLFGLTLNASNSIHFGMKFQIEYFVYNFLWNEWLGWPRCWITFPYSVKLHISCWLMFITMSRLKKRTSTDWAATSNKHQPKRWKFNHIVLVDAEWAIHAKAPTTFNRKKWTK